MPCSSYQTASGVEGKNVSRSSQVVVFQRHRMRPGVPHQIALPQKMSKKCYTGNVRGESVSEVQAAGRGQNVGSAEERESAVVWQGVGVAIPCCTIVTSTAMYVLLAELSTTFGRSCGSAAVARTGSSSKRVQQNAGCR